jgi:hypothetical protein
VSIEFEEIADGQGGQLIKASLVKYPYVASLGGTREEAMRCLRERIDDMRYQFARSRMAMPQDADKMPG